MRADVLSGNLYASVDGKTISFGEVLDFTSEVDTNSANEYAEELLCMKSSNNCSLSFDVSVMDLSILNELTKPFLTPETFQFEHEMPIMIQSRWHKKKRINKKWLNRFGMKLDTVRVRKEGSVLTYDRDSGEIKFETTSKNEYIWRQDQMRKHLKMEWL